ncbi:MAG TPA: class I lanthipeptide [Candidatus Kapabacteria bacterium]|nr:class I lanthipeptide [Candidatus Kapabacteria bacterium]
MKTKKINKKLILNKETISNLKNDEMNRLKGGETIEFTICRTKCVTGCKACTEISGCIQCVTDEYYTCMFC